MLVNTFLYLNSLFVLTRVGIGDLVDFIRIEPDFSLAAVEDRGGQTFLVAQVDPEERKKPNQLITQVIV